MYDPYLTSEDKVWVIKFSEEVENIVQKSGIHADLNLFVIADSIGLDLTILNKEGTLMYALWVAMLMVLKRYMKQGDFKYDSCQDFLNSYDGWFAKEQEKEQNYLWQTANWMHVLFKMITARKNKGLALNVIPKIVEGWEAKYVTGSGQTKATANRVHVFEVEGNVKANQRGGKTKPKKKVLPVTKKEHSDGEESVAVETKKRKKRSPKLPMFSSFVTPFDSTELGTRSREKRAREAIAHIYEAALAADNIDDEAAGGGGSSIEDDVKMAYYKLMRDSSCSSVLGYSGGDDSTYSGMNGLSSFMPGEYSRSITNMSLGGLDPLNFITLTGPSELQRGYSWTEIPVNQHEPIPSSHSYEYETADQSAQQQVEAEGDEESKVIERVLSTQSLTDIFGGYTKYV